MFSYGYVILSGDAACAKSCIGSTVLAGIGTNCHDRKRVKSVNNQYGVTSDKVCFLELQQCFSGLDVFDEPDILQMRA